MPRNILMLSMDDFNAWAWAKAEYQDYVQTPNLDALFAQGTRFGQAYAQVALCNPSRTSALCGMHPPVTGVHDNATP